MPITILDGILIAITLFSAVLAMVRGFSREVLSVASWIAAALAALFLHQLLLPYISNYIKNDTIALIVAALIIFLVALIVVSYITMRISDFIIDSRIGALDRTLGFVFGSARGILIVVVGMLFFGWLVQPKDQPVWISTAKSKPVLDNLGEQLVNSIPEDLVVNLMKKFKDKSGDEANTNADSDT